MSLHTRPGLPTKRQFGACYVGAVGFALAGGIFAWAAFALESAVLTGVTAGIAVALLATLASLASLSRDAGVSEALVWTVAEWTALGIALATLCSLLVGFGHRYVPDPTLVTGVLVGTIAAGGFVGAMVGVISGLRSQQAHLGELTQRNAVLNRVLRHNIKNDMNVILGHTTLLREAVGPSDHRSIDAIERSAEGVTRLSNTARQIDTLSAEPSGEPVDLVATLETCLESSRERYPEATFRADLPESAWVEAGSLLRPALENLLENAVEHNDGEPTVHVSIEAGARVDVCVADDGPGMVPSEQAVLDADQEGPIRHGSGLGLWLVKWFVDEHGGDIRFEETEPRGTTVRLTLPTADGAPAER